MSAQQSTDEPDGQPKRKKHLAAEIESQYRHTDAPTRAPASAIGWEGRRTAREFRKPTSSGSARKPRRTSTAGFSPGTSYPKKGGSWSGCGRLEDTAAVTQARALNEKKSSESQTRRSSAKRPRFGCVAAAAACDVGWSRFLRLPPPLVVSLSLTFSLSLSCSTCDCPACTTPSKASNAGCRSTDRCLLTRSSVAGTAWDASFFLNLSLSFSFVGVFLSFLLSRSDHQVMRGGFYGIPRPCRFKRERVLLLAKTTLSPVVVSAAAAGGGLFRGSVRRGCSHSSVSGAEWKGRRTPSRSRLCLSVSSFGRSACFTLYSFFSPTSHACFTLWPNF